MAHSGSLVIADALVLEHTTYGELALQIEVEKHAGGDDIPNEDAGILVVRMRPRVIQAASEVARVALYWRVRG